jgi:hypothetical protein
MLGVCSKTRRCYALKVQRNMCIHVYKNITNKHFILYKYFVVYYISLHVILYFTILYNILWIFYFENHL